MEPLNRQTATKLLLFNMLQCSTIALCAAYAVLVQQSRVNNMASAGMQELPLQQLHKDVNTTQLQLSIFADKVTELTNMIIMSAGGHQVRYNNKVTYYVTVVY